jgi:hypothetical protein
MRLQACLMAVVAIAAIACAAPAPTPDPAQVVHVRNDSPRAVIVHVGDGIRGEGATAARPCGGEVTVAITPDRYEDDGRLWVLLAVGEDGTFDAALKAWDGDPVDVAGDFQVMPIWSSGELAGKLPVDLTVAPDLEVTESATSGAAPPIDCTPAY